MVTTVIREAAPPVAEKTTTVTEPESEQTPSSTRDAPPNVVGLPLPAGQHLLKEAGYKAAVKNTDTTFGIVVPSHFTICKQGKPRSNLVPILAQKYGC